MPEKHSENLYRGLRNSFSSKKLNLQVFIRIHL